MKKISGVLALTLSLSLASHMASAQDIQLTDSFDKIFERAAQNNPAFQQEFKTFQEDLAQKAQAYMQPDLYSMAKTTTGNRTIPVVFHIVLTAAEYQQMGDTAGIITRINSQLEVLNENFNRANADSTGIPASFKPLYANLNLKFALAKKDPQGNPTTGYEFITTTKNGFGADGGGTMGSTYYCSDAKYASSGGANAWDATKYFNVWVTNITPLGVGGVGTPPPYAMYGGTSMFPWAEQGVVLMYSILGKRTSPSQFFLTATAEKGRTLVHEAGHFFNLFHPFGMSTMNNSNCQDDDGVTDTPPQSAPTQSYCPAFPLTDVCSPTSPGVMYVNHMDYAAESCRLMFSSGQKARIYVETEASGAFRYELLQHPELTDTNTDTTTSVNTVALVNAVNIYPNPAHNYCTIAFNGKYNAKEVVIINQLGQVVHRQQVTGKPSSIQVPLQELAKGTYYTRITFAEGVTTTTLSIL